VSLVAARCDRMRDEVTLEALFDGLGWDIPARGRIRCIWPDHDDRSPSMQVYRETNSVHCFSCNKGGDVVQVLWKAGNPEGGEWSIEEALDWAESTFGLKPLTQASSLQSRLRKKLASARIDAPVQVQSGRPYVESVREAFAAAEKGASADQLAVVATMKEYVWSESDAAGVDPMVWATWARKMVFGAYSKMLHSIEMPNPPPDLIDDRPETCRRAKLWELHRGVEYSSPWDFQLL
jgi:hypothetical protein